MPKGKKSNVPNSLGGYKFINVQLDSPDKKRLRESNLAELFPIEWVLDLATAGYKVSVSEDKHNDSYVFSATDKRPDSPFEKHILTGRGSTPANAWYAFAYRHFIMAEQDWSKIAAQSNEDSGDFG